MKNAQLLNLIGNRAFHCEKLPAFTRKLHERCCVLFRNHKPFPVIARVASVDAVRYRDAGFLSGFRASRNKRMPVGEREIVRIAMSRVKEIHEGRAETVPWEEVKRRHGL